LKAIYGTSQPTFAATILSRNNVQLTLRISSAQEISIQYELVDLLGRRLQNGTLSTIKAGNNIVDLPLQISGLQGIYLLHLRQGKDQFTQKILLGNG